MPREIEVGFLTEEEAKAFSLCRGRRSSLLIQLGGVAVEIQRLIEASSPLRDALGALVARVKSNLFIVGVEVDFLPDGRIVEKRDGVDAVVGAVPPADLATYSRMRKELNDAFHRIGILEVSRSELSQQVLLCDIEQKKVASALYSRLGLPPTAVVDVLDSGRIMSRGQG